MIKNLISNASAANLFPQLDYKNNDFHKDHLHPISKYEDLESWVTNELESKQRIAFFESHHIPDVSLKLSNFNEFITKRIEVLTEKLKNILA